MLFLHSGLLLKTTVQFNKHEIIQSRLVLIYIHAFALWVKQWLQIKEIESTISVFDYTSLWCRIWRGYFHSNLVITSYKYWKLWLYLWFIKKKVILFIKCLVLLYIIYVFLFTFYTSSSCFKFNIFLYYI